MTTHGTEISGGVKYHAKQAARETLLAIRTAIDAGLRALGDQAADSAHPAASSEPQEDVDHQRPGADDTSPL